ncbi:hypothetical protein BH24ACT14_BH24ACT14_02400 [soil metagenome]
MWHDTFITVHASAGTLALAAGVAVVGWRTLFGVYFWSLIVMAVMLVGAVATGWPDQPLGTNVVFSALLVLAAFMVLRGLQARSMWRVAPGQSSPRLLDFVGFTLISLFDGFVIVAVLTRGGPVWLGVAAGVLGVIVGRAAMHRVAARAAAS